MDKTEFLRKHTEYRNLKKIAYGYYHDGIKSSEVRTYCDKYQSDIAAEAVDNGITLYESDRKKIRDGFDYIVSTLAARENNAKYEKKAKRNQTGKRYFDVIFAYDTDSDIIEYLESFRQCQMEIKRIVRDYVRNLK